VKLLPAAAAVEGADPFRDRFPAAGRVRRAGAQRFRCAIDGLAGDMPVGGGTLHGIAGRSDWHQPSAGSLKKELRPARQRRSAICAAVKGLSLMQP